jgi:uncharacterized membrane protein YdjX (TVP38/TMEM64 family)
MVQKNIIKWLPLFVLILLLFLFYGLGFAPYFTFTGLQHSHDLLRTWVTHNYLISLFIFALLYVVVAAASLPIAAFLTIVGGYLFGPVINLLIVDICATLGAVLLFLAIKTTFGEILQKKATPWMRKMEKGFQKNSFSYLLFLRLIPLFPFWAVNICAALLNVPLKTFLLATVLGILPGTLVYSFLGNGLEVLLKEGQTLNMSTLFKPEIFWPLFGLAFLSLLSLVYKKRKNTDEG